MKYSEALRREYEHKWKTCEIDHRPEVAQAAARNLLKNKARYLAVERATGVPWFWIAIVHHREAGGNFLGVLHNGEKIIGTGRVTNLVPKGRGPFNTWEAACIDALAIKGLDKLRDWSVGRFWYECERFNGFGYRNKGVPSPYLWSHTNHYKDHANDIGDPGGGKYVADHVYNPNVHDKQLGAAAVLKAIMTLDSSVRLGQSSVQPSSQAEQDTKRTEPQPERPVSKSTPSTTPAVATGIGGFLVALLSGYWWIVPVAIVGILGYYFWRKSKSAKSQEKQSPKADQPKSDKPKEPEQPETPSFPTAGSPSPTEDKSPPPSLPTPVPEPESQSSAAAPHVEKTENDNPNKN